MAKNAAYYEAERKIEEALRAQAIELDLSVDRDTEESARLTELPESLTRLTRLESLNLSGNRLTILPESLARLTRLESLHLSRNQLTALPESLTRLPRLESLNLSGNRLTALPEWLGRLTRLKSLDLSRIRLTTLPESLARLTRLKWLDLDGNQLTTLPESLTQLTQLRSLDLTRNRLATLPESLTRLTRLESLNLSGNQLTTLPESLARLDQLQWLYLSGNQLTALPESLTRLTQLRWLDLAGNRLTTLPESLIRLDRLEGFRADDNPFPPELAAAIAEGLDALKQYLRAQAGARIRLYEAKLILIGEGEVGKSCLLGALRNDPWEEGRPTTYGIEIKPVLATCPETGAEITLNGWDFGGQRVYRPTHQLFFSAPAVYLVVWKPREGPQQGFVTEWIDLVKRREPEARILVVATHGGPKARQPDIDRQELWDRFGKETIIDFFQVESKPDAKTQERWGIGALKEAIAQVAAGLPEMGRAFPEQWQAVRERLRAGPEAWLPLEQYQALCREQGIGPEDARLLLRICHRVGDLIHYEHDPVLRDILVLRPDWLATAISFVLDDEHTRRKTHGLVGFDRLGRLWHDPERPAGDRYPAFLHPIFLHLMERLDLSYRIADAGEVAVEASTSLIGQLVPDVRPEERLAAAWPPEPAAGDSQQVQICRIREMAGSRSAKAEGLFYQLIVRLHKYSLGRADHQASVHWQRGLILEDDTGARALLEQIGEDVHIRVRSPYPERFLAALTYEVQWLVKSFWSGIRCEITVPCLMRDQAGRPCRGLFEVDKLIENKRHNRPEQPCPLCNEWQDIEQLLHNAPAARPSPLPALLANPEETLRTLQAIRGQLGAQEARLLGRFDRLDAAGRELVSRVEGAYDGLMRMLVDEAREGPRLFSLEPVEPGFWDQPKWASASFRVTLWCEHSRLPLPALNGEGDPRGVYRLELPREWLVKSAPFLKVLTGVLGLVASEVPSVYEGIETQLELNRRTVEAIVQGGEQAGAEPGRSDAPEAYGEAIEMRGAVLRQLQAWLKEQDPSFGGLVRVQNKRQEFLWVHPQFEGEY